MPAAVRARGFAKPPVGGGDARKALTLFRHAGETADERGLETVTEDCLTDNLETTEQDAVTAKLTGLPLNHFHVLMGITAYSNSRREEIVQPVTTAQIHDVLQRESIPDDLQLGERAIREVLTDLETMGLVDTWIDSRGREGRVKQIETTFDPQWVRDAVGLYVAQTDQTDVGETLDEG